MSLVRTAPTRTQVPVVSLKSSADPPVEDDALLRALRVRELHRVAGRVEPLVVEGRAREVRALPVPGSHVGAAHAQPRACPPDGTSFSWHPAIGKSDDARAVDGEVHLRGERRGLGRAPRREHRDAAAALGLRELLEARPQVRRQGGGGVEDDVELAEEARPSAASFSR